MLNSVSELLKYQSFKELPLQEFNSGKESIYIIDYSWNYLFVNAYTLKRLSGINIVGKNIKTVWKENPQFNFHPVYILLRDGVKQRSRISIKTKSPITAKAIEITGIPFKDCYFFSIAELPEKEALLDELKSFLKRGKT